jgi:hypothetical protein
VEQRQSARCGQENESVEDRRGLLQIKKALLQVPDEQPARVGLRSFDKARRGAGAQAAAPPAPALDDDRRQIREQTGRQNAKGIFENVSVGSA